MYFILCISSTFFCNLYLKYNLANETSFCTQFQMRYYLDNNRIIRGGEQMSGHGLSTDRVTSNQNWPRT